MNLEKALKLYDKLKKISDNFILAGSARRKKQGDLHDLDIIYHGKNISIIEGESIIVNGDDMKRIKLDGEQIDIHTCSTEKLGSMLLYFTGSKTYGIKLRYKAKKMGYKLNRWGLFEGEICLASKTEKDILDILGEEWITPEERNLGDNILLDENKSVVKAFRYLALYCTMKNDYFRSRAYSAAADILGGLENIRELVSTDELMEIEGIGKSINKKVEEFLDTGSIVKLKEYMEEIPEEILSLTELDGVGPKKAYTIWKELGIMSREKLKEACEKRMISQIKGFGVKTEDSILNQLK